MPQPPRTAPVVLAGFCAFLNLYATQPILPLLETIFRASHLQVSLTITAATCGVALAAPFIGQIADRVGRKRVIVVSAAIAGLTTLLAATATTLNWLVFWRFLQGIVTPGVFAVTVAYINDEWPPERAASGVGAYVSGTILGGFSGRVLAGFIAERLEWQWVFIALGSLGLVIAAVLAFGLPAESRFREHPSGARFFETAISHLRNRRLLATYLGALCVLFTQVALFTYVTFYLAGPPFRLSPLLLGLIFCVYLVGAAVTPFAGRAIDRFGHRVAMQAACVLGAAGAALSLVPQLPVIIMGLALCSSGVFIANAAATSYIGRVAGHGRALAVGIYVTFYYVGGSLGSSGPGWLWAAYGWPGCVGLIIGVQTLLAAVAWFGWESRRLSVAPGPSSYTGQSIGRLPGQSRRGEHSTQPHGLDRR
ncbi:MAG TPA: MFS transporter [Bryobacteraceae bacterium]|nr:MFS transporter [Bryobacteraceae bacterium]